MRGGQVSAERPPDLSVVLVSYQSRRDLEHCLPTLYGQFDAAGEVEVIVVDNHGTDGVAEWLAGVYPSARLVPNPVNGGYAGGNNVGLRLARGRWTLVLNPDTEVRPGSLARLMRAVRAHPDAWITPKLLRPDGTVNACGNAMHYTGITTCRGLGASPSSFEGLHEVPLLSGAAFIAPTGALRDLGGFDERYFMYLEDTELSLRARLAGHPLLCAADAEIVHHYTLGMTPRKFYHLERNRLMTLLRLLERRTLVQLLPALVLTELATWAFALLRGPAYLRARGDGYAWLWRHRAALRLNRAQVQGSRRIGDGELLEGAEVKLPFSQLMSGQVGWLLEALSRPLYRALQPRTLRGSI